MSGLLGSRSWWLPSPGSRGFCYLFVYLAALFTLTPVVHAAVAVEPGAFGQLSQLANNPPFPLATTNEDSETWSPVTNSMQLGEGKEEQDALQMMTFMNDATKTDPTSTETPCPKEKKGTTRGGIESGSGSGRKTLPSSWWAPYTGTAPSEPQAHGELQHQATLGQPPTSGGYAPDVSPDFDRHHFAVWGRVAAIDKDLIYDVLSAHQADLMLLMLGFNDMAWFQSDASGTLDSIRTLVINARAANPNLKFAIANVPQRTLIPGREDIPFNTNIYNALLRNAVPEWSSAGSPIHLVELQENYDCGPDACPAGYDGLHPNTLGEYQIARAFSLTLVKVYGIGNSPLIIPDKIPERPPHLSFSF
ncbi:SGNH/GDSL hydrolase family protein [Aspergillus luchuensis]|uniref:Uncharacterized protein n=1 Tax=Aspergillus kawachii TaxID=1069201 RepID=A0A7R7ZY62_ASPKA|nr:uncharacterized protein AKAW2_30836S [Aspergillus luchuensis]BCR97517.1 hypothetical protein AKAW2_30836S [Aspergillus luchuensis]BCS09983.1 hypothetical protein ALUC_30800S [Aspergillus luchuensis]GAA87478.1 hypothetical protein AKAW_05592 [Aspergillus luchuensis IFO 4308]